ncbi:spore coat protein [Terribacillus sp. DMT04]|uniref:spore coat protein n=1 Tax=Terribacillus sp. DMT04 TaxID=2850441 RepID=UPI001C2CAD64|nr:spore coat protein [Terribacillus sp. DMT04]QXE02037.1 spore coat protein [Terribacillus sp. DMT04]
MDKLTEIFGSAREVTDQVIVTDLLVTVKTAIINTAKAINETANEQLRSDLKRKLHAHIEQHERVFSYMMEHGYYYPQTPEQQIHVLNETAETVLTLNKD